jgi:hypothetical protein
MVIANDGEDKLGEFFLQGGTDRSDLFFGDVCHV